MRNAEWRMRNHYRWNAGMLGSWEAQRLKDVRKDEGTF